MNIKVSSGYRIVDDKTDNTHFMLQERGWLFFWKWTTLIEWFVIGNTTITFDWM